MPRGVRPTRHLGEASLLQKASTVRRILPYIFGLRALLVIIVMVAGFVGVNLRADASTVEPTNGPTSAPTSTAVPDADPEPEDDGGSGAGASDPAPGADDGSDECPAPSSGAADSLSGRQTSAHGCPVYVVATDQQIDGLRDLAGGLSFLLAVIACCSCAALVLAAKGARHG